MCGYYLGYRHIAKFRGLGETCGMLASACDNPNPETPRPCFNIRSLGSPIVEVAVIQSEKSNKNADLRSCTVL